MDTHTTALLDPSPVLGECLEELLSSKHHRVPVATYRLQFNCNFRFEDARRLVGYLQQLGVTHLYASPILKAHSGSPHGYDIIEHNQLNPEIGTEDEFRALVAELRAHGMALILDTVPNHMGVGYGDNSWWQNLLQNGRTSEYATFFDIDWEPLKPELRNKVLIPILGDQYGEELEQGNIKVAFQDGRFLISHFDKLLPIDPRTIPLIFEAAEPDEASPQTANRDGDDDLRPLLEELRQLPPSDTPNADLIAARQRQLPSLLERLQQMAERSPAVRKRIEAALRAVNGTKGVSRSYDALHRLLEAQPYRLAFWRVSAEEINYRRFFDINDLVGLRMEDPRVFAETHKLMRKLLGEGLVAGLRIDHPDGLLNPVQYFTRLQMLYAASQCEGPVTRPPVGENGIELELQDEWLLQAGERTPAPMYVLVEKILEPGEHLRTSWPVDGTVGYDFTNHVNGILIEQRNQRAFTNLYHRIIGAPVDVANVIYQSKKQVMERALSSEVNVLTHLLAEICSHDRRARDFTGSVLRNAIRETIACFPVYRTYIDERGNISDEDRRHIQYAIARARRSGGALPNSVFDFLRSVLLLEHQNGHTILGGHTPQLYFTLKFQQLTGPVMAKGLEDTVCYAYVRFIAVNEVGGSPTEFGIPVAEFHRGNAERAQYWPDSMLATSTHDTKRSEDVRARLDVLSEMPHAWPAEVMKWRRINRGRKPQLPDGRSVPDNNEEYLLYQTVVGAWPMRMDTEEDRQRFVSRIQQYMEKAVHEAKVNLSWINQDPDYVDGLKQFIGRILAPTYRGRNNLFWDSCRRFLTPIMYFGAMNSLTQTLLKLTCPGMPDTYQGQELWDFSLVDPDNRRPVDFQVRTRALHELCLHAGAGDLVSVCDELLRSYADGRLKLWVTMQALRFRGEHRELFQRGEYVPLQVKGHREEHVVAFARRRAGETAIVAAPRLSYTLMRGREEPPLAAVWGDTEVVLPPALRDAHLQNVFTGEVLSPRGAPLLCREVFARFPVALFAVR